MISDAPVLSAEVRSTNHQGERLSLMGADAGRCGRKKRVLHLIKGLGRGGAEMLLVQGLQCANREVFTYDYGYFLPWKDALVHSLKELDANVVCFEARTRRAIVAAVWKVARCIQERNVDLLHCHLPVTGVVGRLAGRIARVPVVYTEHNLMERYHPLTRCANLSTWRLQEKVIAVSNEVGASIRRHAGSSVPVQVVQNGVPLELFQPNPEAGAGVREELGIPAQAFVVGTVAVFRPQKRLHDWLRAAQILRESQPQVHFLLVGEGPLREELQQLAASLGLGSILHFVGMQPDVRPYLSAMDVYMMSSIFEGLPVALLEAMAMERPAVVTAVGGIPEVVIADVSGVLVRPRDPATLARAVGDLLADEPRRNRIGHAARRRIEERFSMARMMRELEECYLQVLDGSANGA